MGEGLAYFSQFKGNEANVEIDTPNVAVQPDKETSFSIFVNSGGQSEVTVRRGELTISTPQGSTRVRSGQMITVQGTGNDVQYKVSDATSKTDWDAFNQDRDRLIEHADSWKHTDRYYTGTQDLDANGKWTEVPDYGQVWVPNQAPGWAPYSAGSWVWEPYYGWTWVSTEPWGWAPYHYGRWFVYGGGWAWWPGPIYGAASDLVSIVQSGRQLMFPSSDSVPALVSESDLGLDRLAGCRLVHVISTIPGGADIEAALEPWVSGSPRCE